MSKTVVLFSGGMDSTYCLYKAREAYGREHVHAVAIDYGQRHSEQELLAARRIAAKLEVALSIYTMRIDWHATLCALSRPLRAGADEDGISHAFVPGRNLHMLTVAAAHAKRAGASIVVIGCCSDDAGFFPDCSQDFLHDAEGTIAIALAYPVLRIEAPLVQTSKAAMVRASEPALFRLMLDDSWSCYTPRQHEPCRECDPCRLRAHAFTESIA